MSVYIVDTGYYLLTGNVIIAGAGLMDKRRPKTMIMEIEYMDLVDSWVWMRDFDIDKEAQAEIRICVGIETFLDLYDISGQRYICAFAGTSYFWLYGVDGNVAIFLATDECTYCKQRIPENFVNGMNVCTT